MAKCLQDSEDKICLDNSASGEYILQRARDKWGESIEFKGLNIGSESIQTFGCECHPEEGDFTPFLIITKKKND